MTEHDVKLEHLCIDGAPICGDPCPKCEEVAADQVEAALGYDMAQRTVEFALQSEYLGDGNMPQPHELDALLTGVMEVLGLAYDLVPTPPPDEHGCLHGSIRYKKGPDEYVLLEVYVTPPMVL